MDGFRTRDEMSIFPIQTPALLHWSFPSFFNVCVQLRISPCMFLTVVIVKFNNRWILEAVME